MAAATMSQTEMIATSLSQASKSRFCRGAGRHAMVSSRRMQPMRSGAQRDNLSAIKDTVDRATKSLLIKDDIVWHQENDESKKKSVVGVKPASGSPEVERRPETGSKSFINVFAVDGSVPETVNARLAMLGITWAILAEMATEVTVWDQLFQPGQTGLLFFLSTV